MRRYRLEAGADPDAASAFFISRPASYPDRLAALEELRDQEKEDMTRTDAIARARHQLHSGEFLTELNRRVAYRSHLRTRRCRRRHGGRMAGQSRSVADHDGRESCLRPWHRRQ